jgi:hypothetical protein
MFIKWWQKNAITQLLQYVVICITPKESVSLLPPDQVIWQRSGNRLKEEITLSETHTYDFFPSFFLFFEKKTLQLN